MPSYNNKRAGSKMQGYIEPKGRYSHIS